MLRFVIWVTLPLVVLGGCTAPPPNKDRVESFAVVDTDDTWLGAQVGPQVAAHGGASGFVLLDDGLDALSARGALMRRAERTLDLQYYIFKRDEIGNTILLGLLKAADRGVRVRLLVDDYELQDDAGLLIFDSHRNVEVRIYNPFDRGVPRSVQLITALGRVDRRMHNKVFAADNQAAVIGGRNIADEYFYASTSVLYQDIDVLATGPAVQKISKAFDLYWNAELAYPISTVVRRPVGIEDLDEFREALEQFVVDRNEALYAKALRASWFMRAEQAGDLQPVWGTCEVVYDLPAKTLERKGDPEVRLATKLQPYIDALESELILVSPYFVPSRRGVELFRELRERGVRVRILTNSLASSDVPIVYSGYMKYRKPLLEAGVELYELRPTTMEGQYEWLEDYAEVVQNSLHAKVFIFDREQLFIGSMNLDPRSVNTNTEIGVVLDVPEMARYLADLMDARQAHRAYTLELAPAAFGTKQLQWVLTPEGGEPQTWTHEPRTDFGKRLNNWFLSFLPIEPHL